jgi:hypothetical protein
VSPVNYELGFYIPEDGILHSHRRENLKSYQLDWTGTQTTDDYADCAVSTDSHVSPQVQTHTAMYAATDFLHNMLPSLFSVQCAQPSTRAVLP